MSRIFSIVGLTVVGIAENVIGQIDLGHTGVAGFRAAQIRVVSPS
jgi:hypothetical protein